MLMMLTALDELDDGHRGSCCRLLVAGAWCGQWSRDSVSQAAEVTSRAGRADQATSPSIEKYSETREITADSREEKRGHITK